MEIGDGFLGGGDVVGGRLCGVRTSGKVVCALPFACHVMTTRADWDYGTMGYGLWDYGKERKGEIMCKK